MYLFNANCCKMSAPRRFYKSNKNTAVINLADEKMICEN